jgi:hypothetical protein
LEEAAKINLHGDLSRHENDRSRPSLDSRSSPCFTLCEDRVWNKLAEQFHSDEQNQQIIQLTDQWDE